MPMTPFESEGHLAEDLGMFEAAVHAPPAALERPTLRTLVAALDGSNQDATVQAFAAALTARTGVQTQEVRGATAAADILRRCGEHQASLLILPVPFGRDINTLRDESLGSVVDMLLQESSCPVLCVRQPLDGAGLSAALDDLVLPVSIHDETALRAASWATALLQRGGRLEVLEVADRDAFMEARTLLGGIVAPDTMQDAALRAVTHDTGSLVAALQKYGLAEGVGVHVEAKVGRPGPVVVEEANKRPRLVVVGAVKDHTAPAYHRAADIILGATGPVLVVY